MVEYVVKKGETLSAIARRFGLSREVIIADNKITDPNRILAGSKLQLPPEPKEDYPMSNDAPKSDDSAHAADHVEGVMDAMDAVFGEVKAAANEAIKKMKAEGDEMKANMQMFDQRVVGRMRQANSRFRNFIGGNGGPPLDDAKVIEHKKDE